MQKAQVLKQILTPDALERLGRVKLVKKEKVETLEMKLIQMAMRGEIQRARRRPYRFRLRGPPYPRRVRNTMLPHP